MSLHYLLFMLFHKYFLFHEKMETCCVLLKPFKIERTLFIILIENFCIYFGLNVLFLELQCSSYSFIYFNYVAKMGLIL